MEDEFHRAKIIPRQQTVQYGHESLQGQYPLIIANSLPEIFAGARVAMGVCRGTVVATELVTTKKALARRYPALFIQVKKGFFLLT